MESARKTPPRRPAGGLRRRWASRNEAAEYAACSVRKIAYLIAAGQLPAYRLTGPGSRGSVMIDLNDVDALIEARPIVSATSVGVTSP